MRVFTAIELGDEIRDYLFDLENALKDTKIFKIGFVFKKNLHITLKFFGEVSRDKVIELKKKLKSIKFSKFKIKLDGIGFFPNDIKINVIWVGVKPENEIIELQKSIDSETLGIGEVKLGAHITLGRIKSVKDRNKLLERIKKLKVRPLEFSVDSFTLFDSVLSKEGASYEILEKYGLN